MKESAEIVNLITDLWEAQMQEYPQSVFMPIYEVYQWCDEAPNEKTKSFRYQQIAMALQYGPVAFYRIEGTEYQGFRFGTEPHEYMSLFSGEGVIL